MISPSEAAAMLMIDEVERLYARAVKSDPQGASAPWAGYLRTGYGTEVGIDEWKTSGLDKALTAGEQAQWMSDGQAIVNACINIIEINNFAADTKWNVYLNAFKTSVTHDIVAVGDAAADAAESTFGWMPWVFGSLAVVTGGIVIYEIAKSAREISRSAQVAGDELRQTTRAAGGAARRRLNGARR